MDELDRDGDGRINKPEYDRLMRRLNKLRWGDPRGDPAVHGDEVPTRYDGEFWYNIRKRDPAPRNQSSLNGVGAEGEADGGVPVGIVVGALLLGVGALLLLLCCCKRCLPSCRPAVRRPLK